MVLQNTRQLLRSRAVSDNSDKRAWLVRARVGCDDGGVVSLAICAVCEGTKYKNQLAFVISTPITHTHSHTSLTRPHTDCLVCGVVARNICIKPGNIVRTLASFTHAGVASGQCGESDLVWARPHLAQAGWWAVHGGGGDFD